MTNKQIKYFNQARNVSYQSDYPRIDIGAVLVLKHKVISSGCNTQST